jgi:hypothetical protein
MSVYFLRHQALIKIGFSSDLPRRIRAIISTIPGEVEFLGHMPGGREVEAHFHDCFADSRFSGEWFAETPALSALIDAIALREMPAESPEPSALKRLDNDEVWRQQSERVRHWASLNWPALSHKGRLAELQRMLPFSRRRVRALYNYEPGQTLRAFELEAIDELMSPVKLDTTPTD